MQLRNVGKHGLGKRGQHGILRKLRELGKQEDLENLENTWFYEENALKRLGKLGKHSVL